MECVKYKKYVYEWFCNLLRKHWFGTCNMFFPHQEKTIIFIMLINVFYPIMICNAFIVCRYIRQKIFDKKKIAMTGIIVL
jgi:hypothetical protein